MAMKTWCPRCNEGWVIDVRIRARGEIVYVCEECEALWTDPQKIDLSNFTDMAAYLRVFGLKGDWNELERVSGG
jgi:transposase-like protein